MKLLLQRLIEKEKCIADRIILLPDDVDRVLYSAWVTMMTIARAL